MDHEPHDVSLRDGRRVHLRLAGPQDEAAYLHAFEKLPAQARYMRFMRVVREPNRQALGKVLASFPERGFAVIATTVTPTGTEIVGSALCMLEAGSMRGEFAMTVAPSHGGVGLGRVLLSSLIAAAKARGLEEITGFVFAANVPMLRLATRVGFAVAPDPDDASARLCRLRL